MEVDLAVPFPVWEWYGKYRNKEVDIRDWRPPIDCGYILDNPMDPWPLSEKVQTSLQIIIVNYTPNTS